MLLLSADSHEDMRAWLRALAAHRHAPPCVPTAVAQLLALHEAHIHHLSYAFEPTRKAERQRGRGRERDLIQDIMLADADEGMVHAEMVQLSDQGVTGLGDEESTAIGWLTAAVQKCARALDLARCLEGTLIGDGRALTI